MTRQTGNVQLKWDALTVEQRLAIVQVMERDGRIGSRLKHKLVYGRWDALGKKMQDAAYRVSWFAALGLSEVA